MPVAQRVQGLTCTCPHTDTLEEEARLQTDRHTAADTRWGTDRHSDTHVCVINIV